MNREDIICMAREAGLWPAVTDTFPKELQVFAALVASAEREACAEVCKKHADVYAKLEGNPTAQSAWAACFDNRDAIRAREQV